MTTATDKVSTLGTSQTDVVIAGVRDMIMDGRLRAGARLPVEKDLAAELGVSRGSLREAVRALAILGVVETRQGDGTYVTALDASLLLAPLRFLADLQGPEDSAYLLAVRRMLEPESAALAAPRITDDQLERLGALLDEMDGLLASGNESDIETFIAVDTEFHRQIAQASGNPALAAIVDGLVSQTLRTRLWRAISASGTVRDTQGEHRAILTALARRDPERARIRMAVHVLGVEDFAADHATASPATDAQ